MSAKKKMLKFSRMGMLDIMQMKLCWVERFEPFPNAQLPWQNSILSTSMHCRKMSHGNRSDINLLDRRAIDGLKKIEKINKKNKDCISHAALHCKHIMLSCECCSFFLTSWLRHFHLHGDQSKQRDLTSYWHTYCICMLSLRERT